VFFSGKPVHPNFIAGETAHCFAQLMQSSLNEHATITIQKTQRKELLSALMNYYRMHLQGMSEVRSHKVLEEVMG
jgi:DNA repair protein RecO (recombination protein O)